MTDLNYTQIMFGNRAVHVPAWLYVQDTAPGVVSFVGASKGTGAHPLRFGSERTHQLLVGEIIFRPHAVYATDELRGHGLEGLTRHPMDRDEMERVL